MSPRRIPVVVKSITKHAEDIRSFELLPKKPFPRFKPGQFLHFTIDPYDQSGHWPESRVFSIASPPSDKERLRITISKKGSYTTRIFNELKEGDEIWVKLPYGDFIVDTNNDNETISIVSVKPSSRM